MSAGYSGNPLWKKLGLREGQTAAVLNAPPDYLEMLGEGQPDVLFINEIKAGLPFYHIFAKDRAELEVYLHGCLAHMDRNGMIWASWPKKASKVPTDITEDVIREIALATELVDVKVCAVDETWSGLKLVIRKELR